MRNSFSGLAVLSAVFAIPVEAATFAIEHTAATTMTFTTGGTDEQFEFDLVTYGGNDIPLNPDTVQASIGGFSFYTGRSAVRPNGALGIFQALDGQGSITTLAGVEFTIQTGVGETFDLSGMVIVDGGYIDTFDSADAEFGFDWEVAAGPLLGNGSGANIIPVRSYTASAEIAYDSLRRPSVTTAFNDSLAGDPGPVFDFEFDVDPDQRSLDIPFQVVPFDFGTMPENSTWRIEYQARLTSEVRGFTEGSQSGFRDPLTLDDQSTPSIQFMFTPGTPVDPPSDPVAPVPLPASLPLLLAALAGGVAIGRRKMISGSSR